MLGKYFNAISGKTSGALKVKVTFYSGLSAATNDHLSKGALLINLSLESRTLGGDVTSGPGTSDDDHMNHQYQQLAASRAKNTNGTATKKFRSAGAFASDSKINMTFHYCAEEKQTVGKQRRGV